MEPPMKRSVKERWAILRKALLEKKATAENFDKEKSLGLVKEIQPHVFEYEGTRLKIYPPNLKVSASTLTGFNNTGNVRIWPAEEAMIDYVHKNIPEKTLRSANIVELGGGFSNLCGQFLAKKVPRLDMLPNRWKPRLGSPLFQTDSRKLHNKCNLPSFKVGPTRDLQLYTVRL